MLWLCGALALTVTWFGIMPSYVNRTPGVAQAAYLTAKVLPTAMAALFGCVAFILSGGTDRYALLIFLGLTVCAAADVLGRPYETLRKQLQRGKRLLIELCRKEGLCYVEDRTDAI